MTRRGTRSRRRCRNRWYSSFPRFCKSTSFCNFLLVTAVVVLVILLTLTSNDDNNDDGGDADRPQNPGHSDSERPTPLKPTRPLESSTPLPTAPSCPYDRCSDSMTFEFHGLQNFSFGEFIERSDYLSGGIDGKVLVRPGVDQDADIKLVLTYAMRKPWKDLETRYIKTEDSFVLQTPNLQLYPQEWSRAPNMHILVRIEVRPGVKLDHWELETANLDIEVSEDLFATGSEDEDVSALQVAETSSFTAVRGKAEIRYWSSRETEVDVISGSISGSFALRDLLSLRTISGEIDVNVDPKKADKDHPRPAQFLAKSVSGSIAARYPTHGYIPEREYRTRVEGVSSSVAGSYILGAMTSLHSESGGIHGTFLPYFDPDGKAQFQTSTHSGSTKLVVLPPYDYPEEPWQKSRFVHKTTSSGGAVNIEYPEEWEGRVAAESYTGSIKVRGDGVKIISDTSTGGMRRVSAEKGDGSNELDIKASAGSVKVQVGYD